MKSQLVFLTILFSLNLKGQTFEETKKQLDSLCIEKQKLEKSINDINIEIFAKKNLLNDIQNQESDKSIIVKMSISDYSVQRNSDYSVQYISDNSVQRISVESVQLFLMKLKKK